MRARYYSPDMKRFINADIVAGKLSNAITLNRFAYANGNPVSFVDPINSIELEGGLGYGVGVSVSDIGATCYNDVYLSFDDGELSVGKVTSKEVSIAAFGMGDSYKHCTDKWSEDSYYHHCSHCFIEEYTIEAMSTCPNAEKSNSITLGMFTITNEGDVIIGFSSSLHALLGGHFIVGFNVTEWGERILD